MLLLHVTPVVLLACIILLLPQTGAQLTGITAGVNTTTGWRPPRRNINDLYSEAGPEWDLYIQGLILFEKEEENETFSYYQITGIHGLPFEPWNGVGQVPGGNDRCGFCTHGQVNFITWHRPFVALFEQYLLRHVQSMANRYSGEKAAAYQAAAATFRLPYWDWASSPELPAAVTAPTLMINGPGGPYPLRNPLYSYPFQTFPFADPSFGGQLARFSETKRCTWTSGANLGVNDFAGADANLTSDGLMLQDKVYNTFTQSQTFESMATTANGGYSFEEPHNQVHNDVSCSNEAGRVGHMEDLNWSAFDPIFMLHHANVDRLLAMWQAIHYNDSMFSSTTEPGNALFGTAAGPVTPDSPLKPFTYAGNGTFFTSRAVDGLAWFGYSYPEIADWEFGDDPEGLARSVRRRVNDLYGPAPAPAPAPPPSVSASPSPSPSPAPPRRQSQKGSNPAWQDSSSVDYSVQLCVERADLPLPCSIELLLGGYKTGSTTLLGVPESGLAYAAIPLRRALQQSPVGARLLDSYSSDRGGGANNPEDCGPVVDALRRDMEVLVRTTNGTALPASAVASLGIEIRERAFVPRASDDEFPRYGPVTRWSVKASSVGCLQGG